MHRTLFFIYSLKVIILSETPKLPATLKYKIYTFYISCTYQSTDEEKCCEYFGPEGEAAPFGLHKPLHGALSDISVCSMYSFRYRSLGIPVLYPDSVYYPGSATMIVHTNTVQ